MITKDTVTTIIGSTRDCANACRNKIVVNYEGEIVGCSQWSVDKTPRNGTLEEHNCYFTYPSFTKIYDEDYTSGSFECASGIEL